MTNCLISGNNCLFRSGGVHIQAGGDATLTNCVITGNTANSGGAANIFNSTPTFNNCTISGNFGFSRGGVNIYEASPVFSNCIFSYAYDYAIYEDGELALPEVRNCLFYGNGGDYYDFDNLDLEDIDAINALSDASGNVVGDPMFTPGATGTWTATAVYDSVVQITQLTDSNASYTQGELIGKLVLVDSAQYRQAWVVSNDATTIEVYGDVSALVSAGVTNYEFMDYNIQRGSSAIDEGRTTGAPSTDYDGNVRPFGPSFDIGAYENIGEVWVDFAWNGTENGTMDEPFSTLGAALLAVQTGGLIWINGDSAVTSNSASQEIDQDVAIESYGGTISLGE